MVIEILHWRSRAKFLALWFNTSLCTIRLQYSTIAYHPSSLGSSAIFGLIFYRGSADSPLMEKGCKDVLKYEYLTLQVTFNFHSAHSKMYLFLRESHKMSYSIPSFQPPLRSISAHKIFTGAVPQHRFIPANTKKQECEVTHYWVKIWYNQMIMCTVFSKWYDVK